MIHFIVDVEGELLLNSR